MTGNDEAGSPWRALWTMARRALLLPALSALTACALPLALPSPDPAPTEVAAITPPAPSRKPAAPAQPARAADTAETLSELNIQPEREPESIIGLDEVGLRTRLGEPQWIEEMPPGVRWQYGSTNCTVEVYFFMEVETRKLRVLSYDVTGKDDVAQSEQQCLADLARQVDVQRS